MKNCQLKSDNDCISQFLRKMIIIYFIIILIIFTYLSVLYLILDIYPVNLLLSIFTTQHLVWLVGFLLYKNLPIKPLIIMYISYIIVSLYPLVCMYWNSGNTVVFFFYLLVLIGTIAFLKREIFPLIFLTLAVMISVFFLSRFFPQIDFSSLSKTESNIRSIISIVTLFAFFVVVYVKRINIEDAMQAEMSQATAENEEDIERDKVLYSNIIEYLENNKPFKDPNFNSQALAKALHSNVYYISKAISMNGSDFPTLINNFRIEYVKSMLDGGALKKYTIDFIYTEAGYKYRSTFNKSFKRITSMTPSDYVSSQNINSNL